MLHADELVIDESLVRRLPERELPGYDGLAGVLDLGGLCGRCADRFVMARVVGP